ncbi:MAG: polysaccharide deacetylase family protein [Clostridia bacterium]
MSNKPLKLREQGRTLSPPPDLKPTRAGPLDRHTARWKGFTARRVATQLVLLGCLAALSTLYIIGLGDPATAVLARKRDLPIYNVERGDKVVSISFDASWGADKTIDILDILDGHNVKTTFFLVGSWVDKFPEMVTEISARGHEIGNHSDTHPHMSQLGEKAIKDELRMMSDKVETLTDVRPTLFRPPYGDYNDRVVQVARVEGYQTVQWSIDSLDWKDRGTADIIKQCTHRVDNGDIVLFHNDSKDIVNALPTVIKHYQGLGYQIIPVSQILLTGDTTIDVQGKQHPKAAAEPKQ